MKIFKNIKGFTIIELLVVMFILAIIGTVAAGIFTGTLRAGNKGNSINEIRQNGTYVLSQMSKMISYSEEFQGVSLTGASGSYSVTCLTGQAHSYLKIKSFDGGVSVFSCAGNTISSNSASLIDIAKMSVTSCQFFCTRINDSRTPTIRVLFNLTSQNQGSFVENNSTVSFETTIQPRN